MSFVVATNPSRWNGTFWQVSESNEMAEREAVRGSGMEKLCLTVPEAAALCSLGQTSIYKAIREGWLRIRKYGTRTIIMRADLASFLENLPQEPERRDE